MSAPYSIRSATIKDEQQIRAFSGEVDTGSPSENAIKQREMERAGFHQNGIRSSVLLGAAYPALMKDGYEVAVLARALPFMIRASCIASISFFKIYRVRIIRFQYLDDRINRAFQPRQSATTMDGRR